MDLTYIDQPKRRWIQGWETVTLLRPVQLKIHTIGPEGLDILHVGPSAGKQWVVKLRVEIAETDIS